SGRRDAALGQPIPAAIRAHVLGSRLTAALAYVIGSSRFQVRRAARSVNICRSTSRSQKAHTMKKKITKNTHERPMTRRQMVGSALAAAGVVTGAPTFLRALNLHNKLNIAMIACGGRALANMNGDGGSRRRASDAPSAAPTGIPAENITVLCDVNQNAVEAAAQRFPKAKKYNECRRACDHGNDS